MLTDALLKCTNIPLAAILTGNGYVIGGYGNPIANNGGYYREIDGTNFDTGTSVNPAATIQLIKRNCTGISSLTDGFCLCGQTYDNIASTYPLTNDIDKLNFATEVCSHLSTTTGTNKQHATGLKSDTNGYVLGGDGSLSIDRFNLSTHVNNTLATSLLAYTSTNGISTTTRGYSLGGVDFSITAFEFSSETLKDVWQRLLIEPHIAGIAVNSDLLGYVIGSNDGGWNIDKFILATENTAAIGATLANGKSYSTGFHSTTKGYIAGGYRTGILTNEVQNFIFASESTTSASASLTIARGEGAGVHPTPSPVVNVVPAINPGIGYIMGGYISTYSTAIDRFSMSSHTVSALGYTLAVARHLAAGVNSPTKGYCMGGTSSTIKNEIDGILFSTEVAINPSAVLSVAKYYTYGINSSLKGYAVSGSLSSTVETNSTDAIVFSTETMSSPVLYISISCRRGVGVCSNTKGYKIGGDSYSSGSFTTVNGIQFSDETFFTTSATIGVYVEHAGVNSASKGYALGGFSMDNGNLDNINGIDFTTETALSISTLLTLGRFGVTGINSNVNGYACGGYAGTTNRTTIDGIIFDTEVSTGLISALSVAKRNAAGIQSGGYL
jgi:hypothetical protein